MSYKKEKDVLTAGKDRQKENEKTDAGGCTWSGLLRETERRLRAAGVPEPETDAALLLEEISGLNRAAWFLKQHEPAPQQAADRLEELTAKRAARIPLQHLLGTAWFMGLPFAADGRALIPRPDTETLAELVLEAQRRGEIPEGASLLDLCTGSGCIAVSLAKLGSFGAVTAADLSEEALEAAAENAARNGCPQIHLMKSDLLEAFEGTRFDVITANPPYIARAEIPSLMPEVRDHDPLMALDGGEDGLVFYRRLAVECPAALRPGGSLFLEIGWDQGAPVRELLLAAGFAAVQVHPDLAGNDRVVSARLPV